MAGGPSADRASLPKERKAEVQKLASACVTSAVVRIVRQNNGRECHDRDDESETEEYRDELQAMSKTDLALAVRMRLAVTNKARRAEGRRLERFPKNDAVSKTQMIGWLARRKKVTAQEKEVRRVCFPRALPAR